MRIEHLRASTNVEDRRINDFTVEYIYPNGEAPIMDRWYGSNVYASSSVLIVPIFLILFLRKVFKYGR